MGAVAFIGGATLIIGCSPATDGESGGAGRAGGLTDDDLTPVEPALMFARKADINCCQRPGGSPAAGS